MPTAPPEWTKARALARRQWTDEQIVGALTGDHATDDEVAAALGLVTRGHASLERARDEGKGLIRSRVWDCAMGHTDMSKAQWQALYALGRAHVGYGETHDAAQLRELLRQGKAAARANGGRLGVVKGGRTG